MIELIIPTTIFISGILLCISTRTINRASNRKTNNYPANNEVDNNQNINNYFYFYDTDPPPYSEE